MIKDYDLITTNYGRVRKEEYHIAILPWGATEPHNYHLPYLTDCYLSQAIGLEAARLAWEKDVHTMVLPPVPFGAQNPGQRELPFCIHTRYETQAGILSDIVESLDEQGINILLILNGHGGNSFKNMIRDLAVDYPDFLILSAEWWKAAPEKEYFEMDGEHAHELETSVMMHYLPELVELERAGEGKQHGWAVEGLRKGIAWTPRNWLDVTEDTGIGDPRKATPEKGKAFAEACAREIAQLLVDLVEGDELYEE
ncbi:hypothetical protein IX339_001317 [Porphyromonas levii]|uniref:creatininase family protein n=1 Tax=Porphyromonas levii TaxID=28114 RepID=UPI001B8AE2FF|nr:creatininase family protein [Porphyromonas levii]MBR8731862.1 hypothetical protein [Porphyromonas levii]